jgi:hypothetical protein
MFPLSVTHHADFSNSVVPDIQFVRRFWRYRRAESWPPVPRDGGEFQRAGVGSAPRVRRSLYAEKSINQRVETRVGGAEQEKQFLDFLVDSRGTQTINPIPLKKSHLTIK